MKEILNKAKFIIYFSSSFCFATRWLLVGLSESSGWRIRNFPLSISLHHGFPCLYISHWGWTIGPLVVAVQRHSLAPSTWSSLSSTCIDGGVALRADIRKRNVCGLVKVSSKSFSSFLQRLLHFNDNCIINCRIYQGTNNKCVRS
jgi:hypothetical protein